MEAGGPSGEQLRTWEQGSLEQATGGQPGSPGQEPWAAPGPWFSRGPSTTSGVWVQASQGRDSHWVDGRSSKCDWVLNHLNRGPGLFQTSPGSPARARSEIQAWRRRWGAHSGERRRLGQGARRTLLSLPSALTSFWLLPTLTSYLYFRLFHGWLTPPLASA